MTIFEVIKEVFMPRSIVLEKHEEQYRENEQKIRGHLRSLEPNAIRRVTEATDEAVEFHNGPRT